MSATSPRRYPPELKARAVRMVEEIGERGATSRVADQLDINRETLRNWVVKARRDRGEIPGELGADEREELKRLRKENFEQQRAIEILKAASAYAGDVVKQVGRRAG